MTAQTQTEKIENYVLQNPGGVKTGDAASYVGVSLGRAKVIMYALEKQGRIRRMELDSPGRGGRPMKLAFPPLQVKKWGWV